MAKWAQGQVKNIKKGSPLGHLATGSLGHYDRLMAIGRDILYTAGAAVTSPLWGLAMLRTGKWKTDWPARLGRTTALPPAAPGVRTLLLYGVSVGEINALRGLVAELAPDPTLRVVVAAMTDTGFARATALYGDHHPVVRFPYDLGPAVRRFLNAVKPDAVGLVELEIWPNFMEACAQRNIPVAVINGRLSERSFKRYRQARAVLRSSFARLSAVGAQTDAYAERFVAMGTPADRVQTLDTLKWDNAQPLSPSDVAAADQLAADLGIDPAKPLVVAGSTAPGEDKRLIDATPDGVQLLIAPRKPEWFDQVMAHAPHAVRRSKPGPAAPDGGRVFLLDTVGELRLAYHLATVAVVGRSFHVGLHGSDMMEPVALGKPTLIGPDYGDFTDTMAALLEAGGIVVTSDPGAAIREFLDNPTLAAEVAAAGRAVVEARRGATQRYAALLRGLLPAATMPAG